MAIEWNLSNKRLVEKGFDDLDTVEIETRGVGICFSTSLDIAHLGNGKFRKPC